jgi:hypothetical protein
MFACPDLKLAWMQVSGAPDAADRVLETLEFANDMFLNCSSLSQALLPELFAQGTPFRKQMLERITESRTALLSAARAIPGVRYVEPAGGIYCPLRIDTDRYDFRGYDDERLAVELLRKERVYVHPGYLYGFDGGTFLVTSFLAPPERIFEGMQRLARFLTGAV